MSAGYGDFTPYNPVEIIFSMVGMLSSTIIFGYMLDAI
jgi:hypothetical protein